MIYMGVSGSGLGGVIGRLGEEREHQQPTIRSDNAHTHLGIPGYRVAGVERWEWRSSL